MMDDQKGESNRFRQALFTRPGLKAPMALLPIALAQSMMPNRRQILEFRETVPLRNWKLIDLTRT